MSYHGVQLIGIGIIIASLAVGTQEFAAFPTSAAFGYTPNFLVAILGVIVTVLGALVDPLIENILRQRRGLQPKS